MAATMLMPRIAALAAATPQKAAFIHNGERCSYAAFAARIAQALGWLQAQRLPSRGVLALAIEDLPQAWAFGIAARELGLDTLAVARPEDVADHGLPVVGVLGGSASQPHWLVAPHGEPGVTGVTGVTGEADAGPGAHIIPTSGTTGAPRLIRRDARVEASTLDLHARINGVDAGSLVYVRDFPLWTAGGYRWPLLTWWQGATVVFQQGGDFERPINELPLSHAFATPMTLLPVLQFPDMPLRRNDAMRLLVTGGAMPRALVAALRRRLTTQVDAVLASTEALTVGCTRVAEDDDSLGWHRVHPSREAQVVDEHDHEPLPHGSTGLLRVRVLDGVDRYLNDEAASRIAFRDGWFYSGDLAEFDAAGERLALRGRVAEVLNVLGTKIPTAALEAALQERLGAEAVCLLSLPPQPGADEQVQLVVQARRPMAPAELQAAARELLQGLGPVRFHQLDALPRNRMGKVLRLELQRVLTAMR